MRRPVTLAFDRSVRSFDDNGNLHLEVTNVCRSGVSGYFGFEIPDADSLGLDPNRTYMLLRSPEELKKAVPTCNRLPLLSTHVITTADNPQKQITVGCLGSDAVWEAPYIKNSITVWAADDIADIESGAKRELSPAYRYVPIMTPGTYLGERYDGLMTDISFNHLAIVPEGRQGPDVMAADSRHGMAKSIDYAAMRALYFNPYLKAR